MWSLFAVLVYIRSQFLTGVQGFSSWEPVWMLLPKGAGDDGADADRPGQLYDR